MRDVIRGSFRFSHGPLVAVEEGECTMYELAGTSTLHCELFEKDELVALAWPDDNCYRAAGGCFCLFDAYYNVELVN